MIDLQKALGGFWFSSASKFRDGEVVFYHEKGVSIHPLILFPYDYLVKAGFSFDLSDHLENPEHHPRVMGCDTLTPKDIRLSNIHQTTNPLIARPLSEKS